MLGGAGPAIAAVPLTAIWAGGSVLTLLASVGRGKVGPVGAVQRVSFVLFMSIAGVVSSFSRMVRIMMAGLHVQHVQLQRWLSCAAEPTRS